MPFHGCTIEDLCLIGIGAIVLNTARVKTGSIVAAGSLVKEGQQVGPNALVAGTPASTKRNLAESSNDMLVNPVNNYLKLAQMHASVKLISK